jgi:hypothetical protein
MNEQLLKFIELCLTDGVITDKEREVIFRKAAEYNVDIDECEIILESMIQQKNISQNITISNDEVVTDVILNRDSLFREASEIFVEPQQGSASLLQRKLYLGYNRAGRLIDELENAGIVGAFDGVNSRKINIPNLQLLEYYLNNGENMSKIQFALKSTETKSQLIKESIKDNLEEKELIDSNLENKATSSKEYIFESNIISVPIYNRETIKYKYVIKITNNYISCSQIFATTSYDDIFDKKELYDNVASETIVLIKNYTKMETKGEVLKIIGKNSKNIIEAKNFENDDINKIRGVISKFM